MELKQDLQYEIKESENPKLRDIFADLARDHGFPIYWYNEDNTGDIQVDIHSTFISDLDEIISSNVYDYNDTLKELLAVIKENSHIPYFYYN